MTAAVKLNLSLDAEVAVAIRTRAVAQGKSMSRYLADLVQQEQQQSLDEMACEGYRSLSAETSEFAHSALPLANETWPAWSPEPVDAPEPAARERA